MCEKNKICLKLGQVKRNKMKIWFEIMTRKVMTIKCEIITR